MKVVIFNQQDLKNYSSFDTLRTTVFEIELGYKDLGKKYDAEAEFIGIYEEDTMIAGVKICYLKKDFPHRELFLPLLKRTSPLNELEDICMINAVAVHPNYRGKKVRTKNNPFIFSKYSKILCDEVHSHTKSKGINLTILSVLASGPFELYKSYGFKFIGEPIVTQVNIIINMARLEFNQVITKRQISLSHFISSQNQQPFLQRRVP